MAAARPIDLEPTMIASAGAMRARSPGYADQRPASVSTSLEPGLAARERQQLSSAVVWAELDWTPAAVSAVWSEHGRLMHVSGRSAKSRNSSQAPRVAEPRRDVRQDIEQAEGSLGLASNIGKCRVQPNLLAAVADPELVAIAIEPGNVPDVGPFAWRLESSDASRVLGRNSAAVGLADTGRRVEN